MPELGVNIDHVATLRQARGNQEPDPVWAAVQAELGGADCITIHLREDRRHIQDRDYRVLLETASVRINLEMACDEAITRMACETPPAQVTLVPERREELTTEGGLSVQGVESRLQPTIDALRNAGIAVSLFLDPSPRQIEAAITLDIDAIELHTGSYANASGTSQSDELVSLTRAAELIGSAGVAVHAGHGLNYVNVEPVAAIPKMHELNIGHSIISRAVFCGLTMAVRDMKKLISHSNLSDRDI